MASVISSVMLDAAAKKVTLSFEGSISATSTPAKLKAAIKYAADSGKLTALAAGDKVEVSGNQLVLTFSKLPTADSLSFTIAANALNGISQVLTSSSVDTKAPALTKAETSSDGSQVILSFSESLASTTADKSAFKVYAGSTQYTVSSVAVDNKQLVLSLSSPISFDQQVKVDYVAPANNASSSNLAVQDIAGNDAIKLSAVAVSNLVSSIVSGAGRDSITLRSISEVIKVVAGSAPADTMLQTLKAAQKAVDEKVAVIAGSNASNSEITTQKSVFATALKTAQDAVDSALKLSNGKDATLAEIAAQKTVFANAIQLAQDALDASLTNSSWANATSEAIAAQKAKLATAVQTAQDALDLVIGITQGDASQLQIDEQLSLYQETLLAFKNALAARIDTAVANLNQDLINTQTARLASDVQVAQDAVDAMVLDKAGPDATQEEIAQQLFLKEGDIQFYTLVDALNQALTAESDFTDLVAAYDQTQTDLTQLQDLIAQLITAKTEYANFGNTNFDALLNNLNSAKADAADFDAVVAALSLASANITAFDSYSAALDSANANVKSFDALVSTLNQATTEKIGFDGLVQAYNSADTNIKSFTALVNALTVAQSEFSNRIQDSTSPANLTKNDVIKNFTVTGLNADKLDLPLPDLPEKSVLQGSFTEAQTGVTGLTINAINQGIVSFNNPNAAIANKVTALLNVMDDAKLCAAFVQSGNTYVVQGDGVDGMQNSDILIQLTGVKVTDLGGIII